MGEAKNRDAESPDTRGYYDAFAPMHDRYAEAADWPAKLDRLVGKAIGLKRAGPVESALDLGAGTGMSIAAIRRHARPSRIVAVDFSSKMLERLQARYGTEEVETSAADIRSYVAACDETFDLITSMSTLEFAPGLPGTLRYISHLLNKDGVFAATYVPLSSDERSVVHESPDIGQSMKKYYWTPEEIEGSLVSSGLAIVSRDNIPAYEEGDVMIDAYNFVVAAKTGHDA